MELRKIESKKSLQLSQAFGAVLTLVLVAVLVIVAIVIFASLSTSFTGASSVTVTNETGGWLNATAYILPAVTVCSVSDLSVTQAWNTSSSTVIPAANYTVDTSTFGITTNSDLLYNSSDVKYSYTYKWGSGACDASESMTTEFGNYTSLIGLVGTIIFLALVIGVLVASFAFGGRKET